MHSDRRTSSTSSDNLRLIFNRLREKVLRRNDKDQHVQRRAIDNLRSRIKHLDPPISPSDTYEQVRPRIEKFDEYHALDSDDLRHQAFDKAIRRLKERDDSRDRRDRRSHDDHSRRGDSHRPRNRHSRSPETDAYAADRKKAQADREKQYKRTGSYYGLSPPPSVGPVPRRDGSDRYVPGSDRNRSPRDRGTDRYPRGGGAGYIPRADPREAALSAELDYGDGSSTTTVKAEESATGSKKRGGSDDGAEEGRESKRIKSEEGEVDKDDVAYRSGSEEGEIEEDE
jgi:pre-mRNA-processing factor 40